MMYYQVYLEKNRGLYTYVDEKEEYRIGDSVFVSFRNQKQVAYIIALDSRQEFPFRVLPILAKTDFPNIPPLLVQLARWMVRYYVSSYEAVLRNMIPRDLKIKKKFFILYIHRRPLNILKSYWNIFGNILLFPEQHYENIFLWRKSNKGWDNSIL